ncbi:MAG: hypothetical protein K0R50_731 [Eubacterium sp.]|jgi:hypothetical protein|nr:hypothetical protein [Eubacterium sp.]
MNTNYDGVKFYSEYDLSVGFHLERAELVLNSSDSNNEYNDINQIIELYNIKQYLDHGLRLTTWDNFEFTKYQEKSKTFPNIIGKFFATINGKNLAEYYGQLCVTYNEDFWQLLCDYKAYERIEKDNFSKLLLQNDVVLWHILQHRELVRYFGQEIASYMKTADESAELLMDQFLSVRRDTSTKYLFPDELTQQDRNEILQKYVESKSANPNYLKLLENSQSTKEFPVGDRLRRDAKNKYEEYWNTNTDRSNGIEFGVEISFASLPEQDKKESLENNTFCAIYCKEWVKENLDYPTLLNNFIYLFEYTDKWFRCSFVSTQSRMSALEKVLGVKGKRDYITGSYFTMQRMKTCVQMVAYRRELDINGVQLEAIFQWFFEAYLLDEFQANGFVYIAPSENTATFEKCKLLASAIDGVLKQYRLFCEDGYVDRELLEMSSGHIIFSDLKSMQNKKYAYSNSEVLRREQFFLYSDQSPLHFTKKTQSKYHSFAQLILNESIVLGDFADFQKPDVEWLISREILTQNENGSLSLNISIAFILKELYENEVICPLYCEKLKALLDELQTMGDIKYESTLFSKPEQEYLNYMLNKSEFSNGHDLRNKYLHDTHSLDLDKQNTDYLELLKIMVLIVIKINEEFCLREDMTALDKTKDSQFLISTLIPE